MFALQACTPIPSLSSEPSSTSLIEACIYSLPSFDHGESPWNIVTVRTPRTNKHTTLMGESINDHSFGADAWRRQTSTNNVPVTCQLCLSKVVANLIVRIFAVFVVAQWHNTAPVLAHRFHLAGEAALLHAHSCWRITIAEWHGSWHHDSCCRVATGGRLVVDGRGRITTSTSTASQFCANKNTNYIPGQVYASL